MKHFHWKIKKSFQESRWKTFLKLSSKLRWHLKMSANNFLSKSFVFRCSHWKYLDAEHCNWCSDPAHPRFDLIVYQMRKRSKKSQLLQWTIKWKNNAVLESRCDLPSAGVLDKTHKKIIANINYDQKILQ